MEDADAGRPRVVVLPGLRLPLAGRVVIIIIMIMKIRRRRRRGRVNSTNNIIIIMVIASPPWRDEENFVGVFGGPPFRGPLIISLHVLI